MRALGGLTLDAQEVERRRGARTLERGVELVRVRDFAVGVLALDLEDGAGGWQSVWRDDRAGGSAVLRARHSAEASPRAGTH